MKLLSLIRRNCKIYFKDKGLFFSSLIAPLILFFLFVAFLGDVYRNSLISILPEGAEVSSRLVEGFAGGWLLSSLLAVSAVSIAFTANMVMVQDKVTDRFSDFAVSPVSQSTLALSYYLSTALVTLMVCCAALAVGFVYLAIVGWYLSVSDVFFILLDLIVLVLFGTALSVFEIAGRDHGGGSDRFRVVRVSLRRVYADFRIGERDREHADVCARHLRNLSLARAFHGRRDRRNRCAFFGGIHGGDARRLRLHARLFRKIRTRMDLFSRDYAVGRGACRRLRAAVRGAVEKEKAVEQKPAGTRVFR